MAVEITIPKLGLTMTKAILVGWSIGTGEHVVEKQIVCVIETDKVTLEMEAPANGLLYPIIESGQQVAVGEIIGYIATDESEIVVLKEKYAAIQIEAQKSTEAKESVEFPKSQPTKGKKLTRSDRILASPAARKLATSLGIELKRISGSGPASRIVLADVRKAAEAVPSKAIESVYDFGSVLPKTGTLSLAETIDIRGIRKIISKSMMLSLTSQAQLTLHSEASAVALRDTRALLNTRLKEGQPRVSYNAIIVKATAQALRQYPMINAVVDGRQIKIWEQIHIGMAMDFGKGLLVPKIRNADIKSIQTISAELSDLTVKAKTKKLLPDELQDGTFTITNLGNWDIDQFTPITNFPESAILGMGRIVEKPWVRDGMVVAEPRIALNLTFDHRIIDGVLGARFLKSIKDILEETRLML